MSPISDRRLLALLETSTAITSTLEIEELFDLVLEKTSSVLKAAAASVILLDEAGGELMVAAASGRKADEVRDTRFQVGKGIAGSVAQTGKPRIVKNAQADADHFKEIDRMTGFTTRSLMCVPLSLRGRVIGVMEVINRTDGGSFTDEDLEVFGIFANLCAVAIRNAHAYRRVKMENIAYRREKLPQVALVAHSPAMREVMSVARRVAVGNSTVLLRGETGVGKEVLARYIHQTSRRRTRPLVSVNCAALAENLLNSELFGHEKGSFTGATEQRLGRFELADGGSIFLDEIGDAAPSVQARLLRVLQEKTFERLGGSETLRTDVRVLAASNRNLEDLIREKQFREDLFYRLNVVPITIPPLRERPEEVEPLTRYFTNRIAAELKAPPPYLSRDVLHLLSEYRWPGNVRELANVIERAIVVCNENMITPSDLPVEVRSRGVAAPLSQDLPETTLSGREKQMIEQALARAHWNQNETARILGISRYKLRYRIRKFGIQRPR